MLVITAHYDHLGVRDGAMYPGADDNASGVAVTAGHRGTMPHAAVRSTTRSSSRSMRRSWGCRARGRLSPTRRCRKRGIGLNINLDMVSRSDKRELYRGRHLSLARAEAAARTGRVSARRSRSASVTTCRTPAWTTGPISPTTARSTPPGFRSSTSASKITRTITSQPIRPTRSIRCSSVRRPKPSSTRWRRSTRTFAARRPASAGLTTSLRASAAKARLKPGPVQGQSRTVDLKARLDELYDAYNAEHVVSDPIWIVRRFTTRDDQEVVAFCAAALAFGRVQSVLNSIEGLLKVMGPQPAALRACVRAARAIVRRSSIWCIGGRAASISPRSSGCCGR